MDDNIYESTLAYLNQYDYLKKSIPSLDIYGSQDKQFSLLSLPASPNPKMLYEYYKNQILDSDEMVSSYNHDLILCDGSRAGWATGPR